METPSNRDGFIELLENQICPYCFKGEFKKIMMHISKIHKVDVIKLKDELLVRRTKGFCSEELSESISQRSKNNIHLRRYGGRKELTDLTRKKLSVNISKAILNNDAELERRKRFRIKRKVGTG